MAIRVERIKLGSQGFEVSAQGLGCMGMYAFYGPPKSEQDMIAPIHHVKDTPQLSPTKTVKEDKDQEYIDQDQDQLPVNDEFILLELL